MATPSSPDSASIPPEVLIFFRDIKEHPDDDTPRLIFADWLQEYGDAAAADRGEFLRLQVLSHRLSSDDPEYDVLKRHEAELLKQHLWHWLGPLADQSSRWDFERGLLQVWGRADKVLTSEVRLWAQTEAGYWLDALTLIDVREAHALRLGHSPLLSHLNRLDLTDNPGRLYIRPFFRVPYLSELILVRNRLTARDIDYLAVDPQSSRLRLLDLQHNRLNDRAARLLADSPSLRDLRVLRVARNRISANGIAVLRRTFGERVHF